MTTTILDRLDHHAARRPDDPAYFVKQGGIWQPTSWRRCQAEVQLAARAFADFGVGPGSSVGLLGFNRPPWTLGALAAMATGGAAAGVYTTNAPSQVAYVLAHAEAAVVVVENGEQWRKVEQVLDQLPALRRVVVMEEDETPDDPLAISWRQLLEHGGSLSEELLQARRAALDPDQLASLIYTSGTTGPPKGVMLSHANLLDTSRICAGLLAARATDRALSYLPLAHIAEQMLSIHVPTYAGYPVYYAESIERMLDNLKEVRPTVVFGVPRVWERMQTALSERMAGTRGIKARLVSWAMWVAQRSAEARNRGLDPGAWLGLRERLAERLVQRKVKRALGLDQARICASGAAPIAAEVLHFLAGLGIVIHEVYGQSEGCGPTTWNRPGKTRFGTVGPPLPEVEVRLAADGEVWVRGPNVFLGYLKEEAATAEVLDADGWLHSGDLGVFADGFLSITGRKKEIMITSGGKNIAPNNIESALKQIELVGDAVLIADGRKFISALLTLDPDRAADLATKLGVEVEELPTHVEVERQLAAGLAEVNSHLAKVEQVKVIRVLPRSLSLEAGELTPTLKVKRRVVEENWAVVIDSIYAG